MLYCKLPVLLAYRGRSETLKGLPNIVYTHEDIRFDGHTILVNMSLLIAHFCSINQPTVVPKKETDEGMVVNELYGYVCNPMAIIYHDDVVNCSRNNKHTLVDIISGESHACMSTSNCVIVT